MGCASSLPKFLCAWCPKTDETLIPIWLKCIYCFCFTRVYLQKAIIMIICTASDQSYTTLRKFSTFHQRPIHLLCMQKYVMEEKNNKIQQNKCKQIKACVLYILRKEINGTIQDKPESRTLYFVFCRIKILKGLP